MKELKPIDHQSKTNQETDRPDTNDATGNNYSNRKLSFTVIVGKKLAMYYWLLLVC